MSITQHSTKHSNYQTIMIIKHFLGDLFKKWEIIQIRYLALMSCIFSYIMLKINCNIFRKYETPKKYLKYIMGRLTIYMIKSENKQNAMTF